MLFLYRILETDDEGDPFDHGAVIADNEREAAALVRARLSEILSLEGSFTVRLYPLEDRTVKGVFEHAGGFTSAVIEC
jgi:hypothetical protein